MYLIVPNLYTNKIEMFSIIIIINNLQIIMNGWIYCITNSLYKINNMYKLGYTSKQEPENIVIHHLVVRYGTYFPDVECIYIFQVENPLKAEKHLFELLSDYIYNNEIVKADYITIIKPKLEYIKQTYNHTNRNNTLPLVKVKLPNVVICNEPNTFECPLCFKTFACRQNLDYHINKKFKCNSSTPTSNCEWCDKQFANKYARIRHENDSCQVRRKQTQQNENNDSREKVRLIELKIAELETIVKYRLAKPSNTNTDINNNHITTTNNVTINIYG